MSDELVFELGPKLLTMVDTRAHLRLITMMLKKPMKINGVEFWFQTALTSKEDENSEPKILIHTPHVLALTAVRFHDGLLSMLDQGVEMGIQKGVEQTKPALAEAGERLRLSMESNGKALNAIEALHRSNSDLKDQNASLNKRIQELEAQILESSAPKKNKKSAEVKVEPEKPLPPKKKSLGTAKKKP